MSATAAALLFIISFFLFLSSRASCSPSSTGRGCVVFRVQDTSFVSWLSSLYVGNFFLFCAPQSETLSSLRRERSFSSSHPTPRLFAAFFSKSFPPTNACNLLTSSGLFWFFLPRTTGDGTPQFFYSETPPFYEGGCNTSSAP